MLGKDFEKVEDGVRCLCCSSVINYNYLTEGESFDMNDLLPRSFINFKVSVTRHISSNLHISSTQLMHADEEAEKERIEKGKDYGLNCAAAAYTSFFFSESRYAYEYHITDIVHSGGSVGTKNHSHNFPDNFRPHLYTVLRSTVSEMIQLQDMPFGVIADKMTSKHLTRHMVGIRIPVWDMRYLGINKDIYVSCSPVQDLSGLGLASHIVASLNSFGINESYQRNHISGCAMDGQYVKLNTAKHFSDIFVQDFYLTWDPGLVIELSIKDCKPKEGDPQNFIECTSEIIQSVMKFISYGHAYLELLHSKSLSEHFLTPKIFKSLKFVGHCASVIKSFESDFKSIVSALSSLNSEESVGLLESILRVDFVFNFLFMKDIMEHLTIASKQVQKSSELPWNFPNTIDTLINTLKSCAENLTKENIKSSQVNRNLFPSFYNCYEVLTKKIYQDSPLLIIPLSTPLTRIRSIDVESDQFLDKAISNYKEYTNALIQNLQERFLSENTTYAVCKTLGGLFDFSFLVKPVIDSTLSVTDIESFTFERFKEILKHVHFAPQAENELKQLYFEYKVLHKFVCNLADKERTNMNTQPFNMFYLFKHFVLKNKDNCPVMYKFLSFVVCFPTSEAIVESWGSTIDYLNKCKRNVFETTDILEIGTVDKLAFIKLNGPPPGLKTNRKMLKAALTLMFNGHYAKHFSHTGNRVGLHLKLFRE